MKNYKLIWILAAVLVSGCMFSCKKKKNDNPFGNARIGTVDYFHSGEVEHYRIVYDAFNNVDSIVIIGDGTAKGHNSYKKFDYFGSSWHITDERNYTFTVLADVSGKILKILLPDSLIMLYTGNQLAELDIENSGKIASVLFFTWKNGNVVSNGKESFNYDLSKSGQPGDALRIDDFLFYGRSYIKTTNLPVSRIEPATGLELKYSYLFDGQGRISQYTKLLVQSMATVDSSVYVYKYY